MRAARRLLEGIANSRESRAALAREVFPNSHSQPQSAAHAHNGCAAFVPFCSRISLSYSRCSPGTSLFLQHSLARIAAEFPYIEFCIQEAPKRYPEARGSFSNGKTASVILRKLSAGQVERAVRALAQSSAQKPWKVTRGQPVISGGQESVTGIWDPLRNDSFTP